MSDFPQLLPDNDTFRCELMASTKKEWAGLSEFLRRLAEYPFDESTFLCAYHTVPIAGHLLPGFLPFAILSPCFLLPEAHSFSLNGNTVFTVSLSAITAEEKQFAVDTSSNELINRLPDCLDTW